MNCMLLLLLLSLLVVVLVVGVVNVVAHILSALLVLRADFMLIFRYYAKVALFVACYFFCYSTAFFCQH